MINKIAQKIKMVAIIAPILAQEKEIKLTTGGDTFKNLESLNAAGIISGAIGLVMLGVALVFFFILLLGGFKWVTSEGDEKKVGAARAQITNALIGLAIVFSAWAIMKVIEIVFGIRIISGITIPKFQ